MAADIPAEGRKISHAHEDRLHTLQREVLADIAADAAVTHADGTDIGARGHIVLAGKTLNVHEDCTDDSRIHAFFLRNQIHLRPSGRFQRPLK